MTLATFTALDALAEAFDGAADLPALKRNDLSLEGFADSGTPGIGWKFAMLDGDFNQLVADFGEPLSFEMDVQGDLVFAVEGMPGPDRDAVMRAGVASMKAVLFPGGLGLAVAGQFEDLRISAPQRRIIHNEGRKPIDLIEVSFSLFVTAPTPLG